MQVGSIDHDWTMMPNSIPLIVNNSISFPIIIPLGIIITVIVCYKWQNIKHPIYAQKYTLFPI